MHKGRSDEKKNMWRWTYSKDNCSKIAFYYTDIVFEDEVFFKPPHIGVFHNQGTAFGALVHLASFRGPQKTNKYSEKQSRDRIIKRWGMRLEWRRRTCCLCSCGCR